MPLSIVPSEKVGSNCERRPLYLRNTSERRARFFQSNFGNIHAVRNGEVRDPFFILM